MILWRAELINKIVVAREIIYSCHAQWSLVWRSQPLAKNVGSGTDSVLGLFTDVMI